MGKETPIRKAPIIIDDFIEKMLKSGKPADAYNKVTEKILKERENVCGCGQVFIVEPSK